MWSFNMIRYKLYPFVPLNVTSDRMLENGIAMILDQKPTDACFCHWNGAWDWAIDSKTAKLFSEIVQFIQMIIDT